MELRMNSFKNSFAEFYKYYVEYPKGPILNKCAFNFLSKTFKRIVVRNLIIILYLILRKKLSL